MIILKNSCVLIVFFLGFIVPVLIQAQSYEQVAINHLVEVIIPNNYQDTPKIKWFYNNQIEEMPSIFLNLHCLDDYVKNQAKLGYDSLYATDSVLSKNYFTYLKSSKYFCVKSYENYPQKYVFPLQKLPKKLSPFFLFKKYSFENIKKNRNRTYIQVYRAVSYKEKKILVSIELKTIHSGIVAYGIEMDMNKNVIAHRVCYTQF